MSKEQKRLRDRATDAEGSAKRYIVLASVLGVAGLVTTGLGVKGLKEES